MGLTTCLHRRRLTYFNSRQFSHQSPIISVTLKHLFSSPLFTKWMGTQGAADDQADSWGKAPHAWLSSLSFWHRQVPSIWARLFRGGSTPRPQGGFFSGDPQAIQLNCSSTIRILLNLGPATEVQMKFGNVGKMMAGPNLYRSKGVSVGHEERERRARVWLLRCSWTSAGSGGVCKGYAEFSGLRTIPSSNDPIGKDIHNPRSHRFYLPFSIWSKSSLKTLA